MKTPERTYLAITSITNRTPVYVQVYSESYLPRYLAKFAKISASASINSRPRNPIVFKIRSWREERRES